MSTPPAPTTYTEGLGAAMVRHKKVVTIIFVVLLVLAVAYEFIKTPRWRASSIILMATNAEQAPGAGGAAAILGQGSDPIRVLAGVISSEKAKQMVLKASGLKYEDLNYVVRTDPSTGQITLSYVHRDQTKAKEVVTTMIQSLKDIEAESGFTTADREAANLKKAVQDREKDVREAEAALLKLSKSAKTAMSVEKPLSALTYKQELTMLQSQLNAAKVRLTALKAGSKKIADRSATLPVELNKDLADWRRNLDDATYRLSVLRVSKGDDDPEVRRVKEEVRIAQGTFQAQVSKAIAISNEGLDLNIQEELAKTLVLESQIAFLKPLAEAAPSEGVEYMRLYSRYQRANAALMGASERYEMIRLRADAARVRWSVLDEPYIEQKPANKSLLQTVLGGGLIALFLSILAVTFLENKSRKAAR